MRILLFLLIAFVALSSIPSGLMLVANPDGEIMGLSIDLLKATPFKNFLIPGLCLTLLVGGTNLVAVLFNLQRKPNRYNWAMAGGVMITGWIVVQMFLISVFHWLQFFYLGAGVLIVLLAYQLKGKWAV